MLETPMIRHDIYTADECFLTGTAAEVIAVISLDGRTIGDGKPGPVTKDLLERFRRFNATSTVSERPRGGRGRVRVPPELCVIMN